MSSIAIKSTGTHKGIPVMRLRVIPNNKYSKNYQEHKSNIDAGERPPQGIFESENGMTIESVDDNATPNP